MTRTTDLLPTALVPAVWGSTHCVATEWLPGAAPLTFTAWQLAAGGMVLLRPAVLMVPALPPLHATQVGGLLYLGLVGAAMTYVLWFRGIDRLGPGPVSLLALLSPMVAVGIGWALLGQSLTPVQVLGALVLLGSVAAGQSAPRQQQAAAVPRPRLGPGRPAGRPSLGADRGTVL
jgi:probable blue pigment (indigoidine) exporter